MSDEEAKIAATAATADNLALAKVSARQDQVEIRITGVEEKLDALDRKFKVFVDRSRAEFSQFDLPDGGLDNLKRSLERQPPAG